MSGVFRAISRRWQLTTRCFFGGGWPFGVGLIMGALGQIVQILSIFVPLKVIYLVGAGAVPSYLAVIWPGGSLNQWAWLLTLVAIGLFVVSASLSKAASKLATLASERMVDRIAQNNPELGRKVLRALRSTVVNNFDLTVDLTICALFLVFLANVDVVFFALSALLMLVALSVLGGVVALGRYSLFFDRLWRHQFNSLVESLMLVLFVLFFVTMVAVMLEGYELGFLRSLIVLILTRRMFQVLERAIKRHRVAMQKNGIEFLLD